uniref:Uncharacterized protein n=1 Tax=Ralstonia solanacearum TaxID=305 RepID=A0A0S4U2A7_RALSL|nr:protein of unknown function [Ralstonia solanacearum]
MGDLLTARSRHFVSVTSELGCFRSWAGAMTTPGGAKLAKPPKRFSTPAAGLLAPPMHWVCKAACGSIASDFHAGPLTDPRLLDAVVRTIDAFAPHILLLGGDFVSLHHRHVSSLAVRLGELRVPAGMFGVYGKRGKPEWAAWRGRAFKAREHCRYADRHAARLPDYAVPPAPRRCIRRRTAR